MAENRRNTPKYVYDIPYFERMKLCRVLDQNDKWEELGGIYMDFDMLTIQTLRREVLRGNSPTDELLTKWGHQNHTISELFVLLSKMQHYQAMLIIKQFVDTEYHKLISEGEQNLSRLFKPRQNSTLNVSNSLNQKFPKSATVGENKDAEKNQNYLYNNVTDNFNFSKQVNNIPDKLAFVRNQGIENAEEKSINEEGWGVNTPNSNCGNRNNAQTVLLNRAINDDSNETKNLNHPSKFLKPKPAKDKSMPQASSVTDSVGILPGIKFKELETATNGWDPSTILGKGGFGTVYKGTWKNTSVAIKRTRNSETDENHSIQIQQIFGELKMLNSYRHDNILPLYGFSMDGEDPCLIYQYMPNGSLEDRLLCRKGTKPLSWDQRHNIATGTAKGIQFLHTTGEKPLIHGDIKSANILLDSNFEPKIGDFGLAREGPYNHYTHMKVSRVHGTRPYLPDEFLRHKKFSTKVDTHSFGIVLFELATGLRAYDDQRTFKFLKGLIESTHPSQIGNLIDKKCGPGEQQIFLNLINLGKCCVSRKPKDRPEMVLVLQELNAMGMTTEKKKGEDIHPIIPSINKINEGPSCFENKAVSKHEETPEWNVLVNKEASTKEVKCKTPTISVSPPSGSQSCLSKEEDEENVIVPPPNENPPTIQDFEYYFESDPENFLPLISALGITAKRNEETKEENIENNETTKSEATGNLEVSTSAAGKPLWILDNFS